MRLLVISHACVTPVNQGFYAEVERQTGWTLTLVVPAVWPDAYGQRLRPERWPSFEGTLRPVPVWNGGSVPLHVYRSTLVDLFRDVKPTVTYVHHEPYGAATAQVYMAHAAAGRGPIGFFTWQNIAKRYPVPFRQTEQWVLRRSSFACSGSESAAEVLRTKGFEGPVAHVPGSVDPQRYRRSGAEREALRRELGVGAEETVIGYLGRLTEAKGLRTLLGAVARLAGLPWRLVMVGSGPFGEAFDAEVHLLGLSERVIRMGYVPHAEAPRYLSAFDLLVLPSETQADWKEQFGRVIIEALACGMPVVGSDSGEIPHLLRRTGGGCVFRERDAADLADKIGDLVRDADLRACLAERGRREVLASYTNTAVAARFVETIEDAARHAS